MPFPSRVSRVPHHPARAPKISVLLPTYNYARFLPSAIESILAQTFRDFELIIADDASPDHTAEILAHYAARDARIRPHIHRTNLGMVPNWNWCLQQARGDYIKFLFADDLLAAPDALAQQAALLDAHPRATLAASPRLLIDSHNNLTGCWDDLAPGLHAGTPLIARCLRTRRNLIGEPSAVMFRRRDANRGFDSSLRQIVDLEMWFHLLLRGDLVYTQTPLIAFRRHAAQQTAVNHRHHTPELEMIALLQRYLANPAISAHLPPGSFAHHQVLFRQIHYAKKSCRHRPEARRACNTFRREIPPHRWLLFLLCHRVSRPFENLLRWFRLQLSARRNLRAPRSFHPAPSTHTFLASTIARVRTRALAPSAPPVTPPAPAAPPR
mgnify:CR=1 FL=1